MTAPRRIQLKKEKKSFFSSFHKGNLAKLILPKLATMAINLVSIGPRIVLRSTFQILRTNIWTRLISSLILAFFDLYRFAKKQISKKQLFINLILSAALVVGGTTGWVFGTYSIGRIVAENTLLWIVAGLIGAGIMSAIADTLGKKILGRFFKTDVEDMLDLINEEFETLACEYALGEEEMDAIAKEVCLSGKICMECYCKHNKRKFARELLNPYFKKEEEKIATDKKLQ